LLLLKRDINVNIKSNFKKTYTLIDNTINSLEFKHKHRLSDTAFTRNGKLNFTDLIYYLLNLRKHSSQVELDQFFTHLQGRTPKTILTS